jgi:spermidine synthase
MTVEQIEIPCCDGNPFRIDVRSLVHKKKSSFQEIAIYDTELFGKCLILDGLIQCSEKDHDQYDRLLLQKVKSTDQRVLILGGGDGYVAETALKLNPQLEVTLVDLDDAVIDACNKYLDQPVFMHPQVKVVVNDAFQFLGEVPDQLYDGVVCDLTDFPVGFSGQKLLEFYLKVFSHSRRVLKPSGWISIYAGAKNLAFNAEFQVLDLMKKGLAKSFGQIESTDARIPSFGEDCHFIYGVALPSPDRLPQKAECVHIQHQSSCDPETLKSIMSVVEAVRADGLEGWEDSEDYIREKLCNSRNIHTLLKEGDKVVGYMLTMPHNDAVPELIDADPLLQEDEERYHVMLAEIIPGSRGRNGLFKLMLKTIDEAEKRFQVNQFSMHFRVRSELNQFLQDGFLITKRRRIENWKYYANGEATEYIEAACPQSAILQLFKRS